MCRTRSGSRRWLIVNGGLRYDGYEQFNRVTPRAALIFLPSATQSFKYLFGSAFRAPNAYELNTVYFGEAVETCGPNRSTPTSSCGNAISTTGCAPRSSTYWYKADRLITLIADDSTFLGVTYVNQGKCGRRASSSKPRCASAAQSRALVSYALQQRDGSGDAWPSCPTRRATWRKARISFSGPTRQSILSVEAQYLSSRQTARRRDGLVARRRANLTLMQPLGKSWELVRHRAQPFRPSVRGPRVSSSTCRTRSYRMAGPPASGCDGALGAK